MRKRSPNKEETYFPEEAEKALREWGLRAAYGNGIITEQEKDEGLAKIAEEN
jgi:hypothetical protein